MCLTSVFGMGTGGPTRQSTRTLWMALTIFYVKTLLRPNCIEDYITSHPDCQEKKILFEKDFLVTHTGFEPMLTA